MLYLLASLLIIVHAHGDFDKMGRLPGLEMKKNCGQQVFNKDPLGNIQDYLQTAKTQPDFHADACNLALCRGRTLADNIGAVQHYQAGTSIAMRYKIGAPHTGNAQLRVYSMRSKQYIATLKTFSVFASTARPARPDESHFSVRMPDLAGQCAKAGDCVLQFLWDSPEVKQTYPSCIDIIQ